ncbi:SAF domain-containing protein [Actinacidiphila yeochonensis]|uniref:SAF domain-containing protein n=1 Tax=Actinacidiphila yeochonensis TaxID=89050 RepID=UPI002AFE428A|nr:SAF domain-containing protein [Actinacidiphila yeochonensis]
MAHDVPPGAVLKAGDLRVVKVAADSGVVPVSRRRSVLGRLVRTPLVAGSLLAPHQVGARADFPPMGFSQVALAVEAGGAPPDLSMGERVALLPGPASEGAGVEVTGTDAVPDPVVVGTVTSVEAPVSAGGPRVVTVLVETGAARRAAGLESPRVVVLPAQGREAP